MNRSCKYDYHVFKDMLINKDKDIINEIFELRSQDMGMYDISKTIIRNHVSSLNDLEDDDNEFRKYVNLLVDCDGGVYDIVMVKDSKGYNVEGIKNLSAAVIRSAIEEYGEWLTLLYQTKIPPKYVMRENVLAFIHNSKSKKEKQIYEDYRKYFDYKSQVKRCENFFDSSECEIYIGMFDYFDGFSGKSIPQIISKQAKEGRWMHFDYMTFKTRDDAEACMRKYPFAKENYKIVFDTPKGTKRKTKVWTMRKNLEVEE